MNAEAAVAVTGAPAGSRRPHRALFTYYFLQSLLTGPGIVVALPYFWFRFRSLRYDFDEEGVTVRVGMLFRREVSLTYARIQDIHLVSNVVERWLGIGRIQVQTASGSAGAEATIEGLRDCEAIRDELYRRMRGARPVTARDSPTGGSEMELVQTSLYAAAAELRALREAVLQGRT